MTLHEAIVQVLQSANRAMTTQQIAEELNRNKTYQKRDGSEITEFQIYSRTRRYPDLFVRDGNSIKLKGDKNIEKIIIENFKVFEGQHVFELNNFNVFTGANNSGKSTLFKAISLFSKGLEKGDFPTISLFDDNAGEFDSLVNNHSADKNFRIGFFIVLGEKRIPFKVLYEFVENDYADGSGDQDTGTAKFSKFEVLDINDNVFFGAYDRAKFVITEDNIEYDWDFMRCEYPFRTPSEGSDSSMLMMKFNIELLEEYIASFTSTDYSELISHIKTISGKHNNWWSEYFMEYDYNYSLIGLTFNELLKNILEDPYCGIGDFRTKESIHWSDEHSEEIWQEYSELRERLNYIGFIRDVFSPILDSIESGLEFFRKKNFTYITFQNFDSRLIRKNQSNSYLFSLLPIKNDSNRLNKFVKESLVLFGVDGYVELKSYLNTALEINLVSGLTKTDLQIELTRKSESASSYHPFEYFELDYKNNPRQNIADFGKGTANLIGLILKIFSVFHEVKNETSDHKDISQVELKKIRQKLILVEEPEAFLHPDWQSKLADFFVYCMKYNVKNDVKFLIETHSEYLIRKLQYLTAKKEIKPEDSVIYYFNTPDNIPNGEKHVREMTIRDDGMMDDDFGEGFFDESTRLTIDLLNLQNKN